MISHLSIRKTYSCGILLDLFQYIFTKYQLVRILKKQQLKLFDLIKVCIIIYGKKINNKNIRKQREY